MAPPGPAPDSAPGAGGAGDDTLSGGADTLAIRNSGLLPILLTDADFLL
ncbi:hypothetical protein [Mameliella alba]|nr:hypothetical protein [Mameliella alba]